jgi:hypothetical protein
MRDQRVACTRKEHRCDTCEQVIPIGSPAVHWVGVQEGHLQRASHHEDCREAEVAFNREYGLSGDDWASIAFDREPEDDAWLLKSFPAVAERLGIVAIP